MYTKYGTASFIIFCIGLSPDSATPITVKSVYLPPKFTLTVFPTIFVLPYVSSAISSSITQILSAFLRSDLSISLPCIAFIEIISSAFSFTPHTIHETLLSISSHLVTCAISGIAPLTPLNPPKASISLSLRATPASCASTSTEFTPISSRLSFILAVPICPAADITVTEKIPIATALIVSALLLLLLHISAITDISPITYLRFMFHIQPLYNYRFVPVYSFIPSYF